MLTGFGNLFFSADGARKERRDMKKQTWLARVAVASLVFGMAGAGSLQAAEDYTLNDGTTKTISNREVKTLRVTNGSGLTATNVTVTGGAYAMGDSWICFVNGHEEVKGNHR